MAFKPFTPRPSSGGFRGYRPPPQQQEPEHRTNEQIRVPEVRLIGDNFEAISRVAEKAVEAGVFPTNIVRQWADKLELDLIEITANAVPPVVKIADYNKFIYQKKKKEKELKANSKKVELKEIRFGPETGEHDFDFKVRHAKGFLQDGDKVKAFVQFKGRAIVFKERGELLLLRFMKELEELGSAEALPKLEGKRMSVILTPKKTVKK